MKRISVIFLALTIAATVAGCSLESDKESATKKVDSQVNSEDASDKEQAKDTQKTSEDSKTLADQVEIVKEYTENVSDFGYSMHYIVVKNNSDVTVEVSTNSTAYDAEGNVVGAADGSVEAVGAGCTSIISEFYTTDKVIDKYSMTYTVEKETYYESVIQDISYEKNIIDEGAVLMVTNNGEKAAQFVEITAIFLKDGSLVHADCLYAVDNDSEIKPGATISQQFDSFDEFDDVEFYVTGRREK